MYFVCFVYNMIEVIKIQNKLICKMSRNKRYLTAYLVQYIFCKLRMEFDLNSKTYTMLSPAVTLSHSRILVVSTFSFNRSHKTHSACTVQVIAQTNISVLSKTLITNLIQVNEISDKVRKIIHVPLTIIY